MSIDNEVLIGKLRTRSISAHYNYLLLDGTMLSNLLTRLDNNVITNEDVEDFIQCIFYIGKGFTNRKYKHFVDSNLSITSPFDIQLDMKAYKIIKLWDKGNGLAVLQLVHDLSHFEALSREYAMIKAVNFDNITNIINSSRYGCMLKWNCNEIYNFGRMCLYNSLLYALNDPPKLWFRSDCVPTYNKS